MPITTVPCRKGRSGCRYIAVLLAAMMLTACGGRELWKSDGTATGTILFKDINPDGNSTPQNLFVFTPSAAP